MLFIHHIMLYFVIHCVIIFIEVMDIHTNDFEAAFSQFLDRHEYDEAENALFAMVRIAFSAGWQAAGGAPPQSERIYELLPPCPPPVPQK